MSIKEHASKSDTWIRGLFIVVFGVIFYFLYGIIWLLVVIQFITKVVTGELNSNLSDFSGKLTGYAMQILTYITFQSDEKPWPFSSMPESASAGSANEAETEVLEQKTDEN
ncbi:MAG: DUF4389 domain-containing protein [Thiotrichales bacterium]|nr:DUF4389 domain-containing protein [Thiotrichales bacterium]